MDANPPEPGQPLPDLDHPDWGPPPDVAPPGSDPAAAPHEQPAGWTPGAHDLIPLLPRGTALFEGIPAPALVIEALSPALGDGALLIRRPGSVGVILVKDGGLFEEYAFEGGTRLEGGEALQLMAGWYDASVSAYRFDPIVVAVAPSLFRGTPCYEDLRLEWTDWRGLLADLCSRDGLFVVELDTPAGRGVTLIVNGRQVATYTENHPELGDERLLDPLAATGRGSVWVRREPLGDGVGVGAGSGFDTTGTEVPERAGDEPSASPTAPAPPADGIDWTSPPPWEAEEAEEAGPTLYGQEPPGGPVDAYAAFPSDAEPAPSPATPWEASPDAYPAAPLPDVYADAPQPAAQPGPGPSVAAIATALKQVARLRLQRSASRVEDMVDEAAAEDLPLETLLDEIRGLVIRGVMQSTLDEVVDEMAAMASSAPS